MTEFKDFKFKRAIVTGGAGFIGSHICEELLKYGCEVISVDNYFSGKSENVAHLKDNPKFREEDCDVTDYDGLKKLFSGVDVVFHNAASKKTVCLKDPRIDLDVNAKGTFNMLELSRKFGVKKFVHASTGSVYGEAQYMPQDEKHPLVPTSYYGVSKLAGEKYVKVFNLLYGLDTTVLRYFHVYGPRQEYSDNGGVVSIFARKLIHGEKPMIHGDGTQQRSFTYVKDVVRINIMLALSKESTGEAYNCASGINVTIKELADKMIKLYEKPSLQPEYDDWTPGDIKVFDIDNAKIKKMGFEFKTEFNEGLQKTVEWMNEHLNVQK